MQKQLSGTIGSALEYGQDVGVRCQLITCSLASCLARESLMPCSSCDKYIVDLEEAFHRVPREVVRWGLRKLGVDEWLIRTVMTLYTEVYTVVMGIIEVA